MPSIHDLLAQRASLDAEIEKARQAERAEVIARIQAQMRDYGLTVADITGQSRLRSAAPVGRPQVAAKYHNKTTGETWSGRGLQPRWLKAAIAGGAKLEDFAV